MAEIFTPGSSLAGICRWLEDDARRARGALGQWICSSTRASSTSPATASRSRRAAWPTRSTRRSPQADAAGYPVVVKAQVQVGGRGKAGGIKLANDADEVRTARREHPRHGHQGPRRQAGLGRARLATSPRSTTPSFTLDRSAKQHLLMLSAAGRRRDRGRWPRPNPDAIVQAPHRPGRRALGRRPPARPSSTAELNPDAVDGAADILVQLYRCFTEGDCDLAEINPLILKPDGRGPRPRRQGQPRRQRRLPPPGVGRVPGHRGARRARAAGPREGPAVHRPRGHRSASSPTAPAWP